MRKLLAVFLLAVSGCVFAAQTNQDIRISPQTRVLWSSNVAVAVPASGNTTLLEINVQDIERIYVQVTPSTQAFDAFLIQISTPGGGYVTIASAASDYTAPVGLLVGASGDLTTLAAGSTGWFILDTRGVFQVRVLASANVAGAATATIYAGGH